VGNADGNEGRRLIGGNRKSVGMKRLISRMDRRTVKAAALKWLGEDFKRYLFENRLPNMWRNKGVIHGPYGKGSTRWADNARSTVKKKGFNKPMFSSRGAWGSSLIRGRFGAYRFSEYHRRASKRARNSSAWYKLDNVVEHAKYLNEGSHNMPARWCLGFIPGDGEWLRRHAGDHIMRDV